MCDTTYSGFFKIEKGGRAGGFVVAGMLRGCARHVALALVFVLAAALPLVVPQVAEAAAGGNELVSYGPAGEPMTIYAFARDTSADGQRTVMLGYTASGSPSNFTHYYLRDGSTTTQIDAGGYAVGTVAISDSGRWITYTLAQFNGTSWSYDLRIRDLDVGTERSILTGLSDAPGWIDVSDDGSVVGLQTSQPLVPEDLDAAADVYVWEDAVTPTFQLISGGSALSEEGTGRGAMTPDGRFVLFTSKDRSIVVGDDTAANAFGLYLRDRLASVTTLESRFNPDQPGGALPDGVAGNALDLSDDGARVVYESHNYDPSNEFPIWGAVFVRDTATGISERVVRSIYDGPVSTHNPTIDGAGSRVALEVDWGQAMGRPQSQTHQGAVVDLDSGNMQLASRRYGTVDEDGNGETNSPIIAANGRFVVHTNRSTDLLAEPVTAGSPQVYRYEVEGGADPDLDDDGIDDAVDADGGNGSAPGAFDDGGMVTGRITQLPSGFSVAITDHPDPLEGVTVRVTGSGTPRVRLSVCGGFTMSLSAGAETTVTCGSVIARVVAGDVVVELDGGLASVTIPAGAAAEVEDTPGGFEVVVLDATGDDGRLVQLTVDGQSRPLAEGTTVFQAWDFVGFDRPVDGEGVINSIKGGRVVPLKWRVLDGNGSPVTTINSVAVAFAADACVGASAPTDLVEQTAASASSLQNLGNGYYQFNWKTPKATTPCGELRLALGDGVVRTARFGIT